MTTLFINQGFFNITMGHLHDSWDNLLGYIPVSQLTRTLTCEPTFYSYRNELWYWSRRKCLSEMKWKIITLFQHVKLKLLSPLFNLTCNSLTCKAELGRRSEAARTGSSESYSELIILFNIISRAKSKGSAGIS